MCLFSAATCTSQCKLRSLCANARVSALFYMFRYHVLIAHSSFLILYINYRGILCQVPLCVDHERMRRATEVPIDYELPITIPRPKRNAIMKSKNNKRRLAIRGDNFTLGQ